MAPEASVAASRSVARAFCGSRSISCSVWERCRSVLWLWNLEASVAAFGSVAGAVTAARNVAEAGPDAVAGIGDVDRSQRVLPKPRERRPKR